MSFVKSLPLEIVHEIFLLSFNDLSNVDITAEHPLPADYLESHDYPTVLTSICHDWTDAAVACRQLWSTIPILIRARKGMRDVLTGESSCRCLPMKSEIVRWIARSGATPPAIAMAPLDIERFHEDPREWGWNHFEKSYHKQMGEIFWTILLPHHERWVKLSLRMVHKEPTIHPLSEFAMVSSYPQLKEVSIRAFPKEDSGSVRGLKHLLSHSPQLSTLDFEMGRLSSFLSRCDLEKAIPWRHLSGFSLSGTLAHEYGASALLGILHGQHDCPTLRALSVPMRYGVRSLSLSVRFTPHTQWVRHTALLELDLERSSPSNFILFITHVTLPNLRALTVPTGKPFSISDAQLDVVRQALSRYSSDIPAFIRRSECTLRRLHYRQGIDVGATPSWNEALPLLRVVEPTIEELCVDVGKDEIDEVMEWMTVTPTDNKSFPHLRHLTITVCPDVGSKSGKYGSLLVDMLESRYLKDPELEHAGSIAYLRYANLCIDLQMMDSREWNLRQKCLSKSRAKSQVKKRDLKRLKTLVDAMSESMNPLHTERVRLAVCGGVTLGSSYCHDLFDSWEGGIITE